MNERFTHITKMLNVEVKSVYMRYINEHESERENLNKFMCYTHVLSFYIYIATVCENVLRSDSTMAAVGFERTFGSFEFTRRQ
jgi:hypothetical protein